jgi:hypothetical protein
MHARKNEKSIKGNSESMASISSVLPLDSSSEGIVLKDPCLLIQVKYSRTMASMQKPTG